MSEGENAKMRRFLLWGLIFLWVTFFASSPSYADELNQVITSLGGAVGTNQPIAVVLCRYQGSNTPPLEDSDGNILSSAEQIAELMTNHVNSYYLEATARPDAADNASQAWTTFNFIPIPGICNFDYPDNGERDDPEVMAREVPDAVKFADTAQPAIFRTTKRIIVVVNGSKRNRATMAMWPFMLPNSGFVLLSAALVDVKTIAEEDLSTVSHELGHQLGLPDLYSESPPSEYMGKWDLMGDDNNQNFSAYSRYSARWISNPSSRVVNIAPASGQRIDRNIDIGLPNNREGLPELIRLDVNAVNAVLSQKVKEMVR